MQDQPGQAAAVLGRANSLHPDGHGLASERRSRRTVNYVSGNPERPGEGQMIIISVDRASLPAGAPWPGEFLLVDNGSLQHITPAVGAVDNVAAYQAAGIKGPVTITFQEFMAHGGKIPDWPPAPPPQ
jgi:hypothetical protein